MRKVVLVGLLGFVTACAAGWAEQGRTGGASRPSPFAASAVAVMQAYDLESRFLEGASLGRFAMERARLLKDAAGEARLHAELGRVLTRQRRHGPGIPDAEVLAVLQRARQLAEASGDSSARAAALDAHGHYLFWDKVVAGKGDWETVTSLFQQAHALASRAGDARGITETLFHLGLTRQFQGDADGARDFFERSLADARKSGDALYQAYNLRHLADLAEQRGDLDTALARHRECLRLREQVGFRTGQVVSLLAVAHVLSLREPRSDEALAAVQRALHIAQESKDPAGLRESHGALARAHLRREDAASALPHLEQALANAEAHQDWLTTVDLLLDTARAHAQRGERERVEAVLRRAYALTTERGLSVILEDVEKLGREYGVALR
ncbi:tetratricopeptide repeat protein [Pyxidicoccus fallax]|uniref:Tetratricopeptide repeat protein n=1 Tax=Pyxidicoccus fallax TaxID=394095 RepID=A0A848LHE2_9BACT|nr:tetratricopeptide repeat protein [Pyxidicoccus fallax]NMO16531.1 tetratricopeptide repeat protein [Pyxidicoccus fallax]NPC78148.1 tetratricopeptide repeat protein [Pyxidicoccus fallax]